MDFEELMALILGNLCYSLPQWLRSTFGLGIGRESGVPKINL
jgi:hypothetical protein